ncbi:hypothetical protein [Klebsiella pneumoniae]|uniref:hypothetical protein n=1 Tax=Klebsiella pneumoniae TaxID=573 RepID=UPI0020CF7786|nr:hypothetical protein [Klebsiella pneumoniae]
MTKSTITREQLLEIIETDHVQCGEASYLARMALAAMDSEPVAIIDQANLDYLRSGADADVWPPEREEMGDVLLYRHAQPAPVVPDDVRQALSKMDDEIIAELDAEESVCRAAMLPAAPVRSSMPDGVVTAEHRRVIEMLLSVCGAAFELADDSCQQDVDGEECHVVPSDAFQKLSDALDEIENTLPTEDIDRPDVFLAWSAMPRAALKSLLQAGKSPAQNYASPEQNSVNPEQSPIDHGYRPECECSGCKATARICAELSANSSANPDCWCRTCRPVVLNDMRFVVCPDCGNKRCPRANDHRNACTGSNEPGQEGSAYPDTLQEPKP